MLDLSSLVEQDKGLPSTGQNRDSVSHGALNGEELLLTVEEPSLHKRSQFLLLGTPGAHVFKGFFGLEDEPVKSVKMKVETRSGILWRLPDEFALCSLQFRFALRVSVMFHCVEPHPQKNVKSNKRAVSTKSTWIAIILNPPAGPLRRFDLLQTF